MTFTVNRNSFLIQLYIYSLWARDKWHIQPNRTRVREVNLYTGRGASHVIDIERIEETTSYIRNSVAEMRKLLADPKRNIALPEEYFPMNGDSRFCQYCKFRGECQQQEHTTPTNKATSIYASSFEQEYRKLSKA